GQYLTMKRRRRAVPRRLLFVPGHTIIQRRRAEQAGRDSGPTAQIPRRRRASPIPRAIRPDTTNGTALPPVTGSAAGAGGCSSTSLSDGGGGGGGDGGVTLALASLLLASRSVGVESVSRAVLVSVRPAVPASTVARRVRVADASSARSPTFHRPVAAS